MNRPGFERLREIQTYCEGDSYDDLFIEIDALTKQYEDLYQRYVPLLKDKEDAQREKHDLREQLEREQERCVGVVKTNLYQYAENEHQPWAGSVNLQMLATMRNIVKLIRGNKEPVPVIIPAQFDTREDW